MLFYQVSAWCVWAPSEWELGGDQTHAADGPPVHFWSSPRASREGGGRVHTAAWQGACHTQTFQWYTRPIDAGGFLKKDGWCEMTTLIYADLPEPVRRCSCSTWKKKTIFFSKLITIDAIGYRAEKKCDKLFELWSAQADVASIHITFLAGSSDVDTIFQI